MHRRESYHGMPFYQRIGAAVSDSDRSSKNHQAGEPAGADGATASGLDPLTLSRHIKVSGAAPVHLWNPPYCGEMELRIARDGTWYHEGNPIRREALVKLFSSVLKKEGDRHYLVTPVEKVGIEVDDCPFVARTVDIEGAGRDRQVTLTLNTGEQVVLDEQHPLLVTQSKDSQQPHPTVLVRNGLLALLSRNVFYQLVEQAESAESGGQTLLGIHSRGTFFALGSLDS